MFWVDQVAIDAVPAELMQQWLSWIPQIEEHAVQNYETDGWDYLVECYEESDIISLLARDRWYALNHPDPAFEQFVCETYESVFASIHSTMKMKNEYRQEIVNA